MDPVNTSPQEYGSSPISSIRSSFSSRLPSKNFFIIAGIILLPLLAASGAYLLEKSQNNSYTSTTPPAPTSRQPTFPTISPYSDSTANWIVYTDNTYKYSFKYPPSVEFKPCSDSLCGTFIERLSHSEIIKLEGFNYSCDVTPDPSFTNAQKATMCMCLADGPGMHVSCDTPAEEKTVTVSSGKKGFRFVLNELLNNKFTRVRGPYTVIFFPEPISYEIGLYFELVEKNGISELDQIISTFHFINSNSSVPEKFCGGIAGIPCPSGYTCKLEGNYPDAGGKCLDN